MTDDRRTSPLAGFADAFAAAACDDVTLVERPFLAQVGVRLHPGPGGPSAAEAVLGFPLPVEPNTTAGAGGTDALWLGPDEWLVVAPPGSETALEAELAEALAGLGSVVDLSANRTALEVAARAPARCSPRAARSTCTRARSAPAAARRRCSAARRSSSSSSPTRR